MIKRNLIRRILSLAGISVVLGMMLSSCICEEGRELNGNALSEAEKEWIPYTKTDTVWYADQQGQRFYAVSNYGRKDTIIRYCYSNCCSACECSGRVMLNAHRRRAYLTTNIRVEGPSQPPVHISTDLQGGAVAKDSTHFSLDLHGVGGARVYLEGRIDKSDADKLKTAASFLPEVSLNGVVYQDVYSQVFKGGTVKVDSVYLNKKHGLIRFTTTHGDAYTLER